jgi:hypothetical protein
VRTTGEEKSRWGRINYKKLFKPNKKTMSKEKEHIDHTYDEYQERKHWAKETAKKFDILLDEGGEHFVIPVYNAEGKEIRKEKLSIRLDKIPTKVGMVEKDGKKFMMATESAGIEAAIEAVKRYPDLPLREAVKKVEQEKQDSEKK